MGKYLANASGRAVYMWEGDTSDKSNCTGACAKVWTPVTTQGAPQAEGGVILGFLGTLTRADGSKQVVYDGHPLYYFVKDSGAGQTMGEGSNGFGAKWWLMTPSGNAITSGQSSASSSSSSSGSGGGY